MKKNSYSKKSLECDIYNYWKIIQDHWQARGKAYLSKDELYSIINKVSLLKYLGDKEPIQLTPLEIEIAMNNCDEVLKLVNDKNVNQINEYGLTPLIEAALLNNYRISHILMENGANVYGTENLIPLIIAAENHNSSIMELLLQYGASATTLDKNGFNALHHMFKSASVWSLQQQNHKLLNQLNFAINFYKRPNDEQTLKCIDLLVNNGVDVNYSPEIEFRFGFKEKETINLNPLSLALEMSSEAVLKKLIDLGAERKAIELSPSDIYQYQDSFDFVNDILDRDISCWIDAPLEYLWYLNYIRKIKKYNIDVYSGSLNDGYKRPKIIKKYIK